MRLKPRFWFLLSLLFFTAALCLWQEGDRRARLRSGAPRPQSQLNPPLTAPLTPAGVPVKKPVAAAAASLHLSNTPATAKELARNPHAILLRNATLDTTLPIHLDIPKHLRSPGAPGSYLVQSDRPLNSEFYSAVRRDGGEFISYIPNNTALVRATPAAAKAMVADPVFQAVLPYEPYFKLDSTLLPIAVDQGVMTHNQLQVEALPGQENALKQALTALGAGISGEEHISSGSVDSTAYIVTVPPDKLVAVAQLPQAQEIETFSARRPMNDLTRVRMGVSANTLATTNYQGLNGSNIVMVLDDTGVDSTHPDLMGRLIGSASALTDYDGHGTHTAGTMIGNGSKSSTVTNAPGSAPGANFAGMAPQASLLVQQVDLVSGPFISDTYLQSNASFTLTAMSATNANMPTNGYIVANPWGYQSTVYDLAAASWDSAVRNAQPGVPGEHSILPVFASGDGGQAPGSITSPGTSKNGITTGVSDSPRFITNTVDFTNQGITGDTIFETDTFDSNQVASISSAGNVGAGLESASGRFKPDVVAPGVFTISTRSSNFHDPANQQLLQYAFQTGQAVSPGFMDVYGITILGGTTNLAIQILPNEFSPVPFPTNLQIYFDLTNVPGAASLLPASQTNEAGIPIVPNPAATNWFIGIASPSNQPWPVNFDLRVFGIQTNAYGTYYSVLGTLNSNLAPWYRYESGSSMAAAAEAGMLGLVQQFFVGTLHSTPSPALLHALTINGARALNGQSDFNQAPTANTQGWGLPNITNVIPSSLSPTNHNPSMVFFDQSPTNALQTGEWHTYTVNTTDVGATNYPLRITLTWTDPPGNPAAGNALVNDLDLVVADVTGTNVYVGNDFPGGNIYTEVNPTNGMASSDTVNNVENVYIDATYGLLPPYTIYVKGTRVNVNAATTQTNVIGQDYALVISTDDQSLQAPLTVTDQGTNQTPPPYLATSPVLITPTQTGSVLLHQRVGANEPNLAQYPVGLYSFPGQTNGNINQWHFFVVANNNVGGTNLLIYGTNTARYFTNVFFTTFLPPTLTVPISSPVNESFQAANNADIDLYVSTNPAFLTLNPVAVAQASKSLGQGGNELVLMTNIGSVPNFYVGVKSESQQGADFAFFSALTTNFDSPNGLQPITVQGYALPALIPDSMDPTGLEGADVIAVIASPITVRKVAVTVGIEDAEPADLFGTLVHNATTADINHFTGNPGGFTNVYDDLPDGSLVGSVFPVVNSDGPANLMGFIGQSASGAWRLNEKDVAFTQTGMVTMMSVTVWPQPPLLLDFFATLPPNGSYYGYVDVPDDATNLIINVSPGPIGIYLTNQPVAQPGDYGTSYPGVGGGSLTNSTVTNNLVNPPFSGPPLSGGRWYYDIINESGGPLTVHIIITIQESVTPNLTLTLTNAIPGEPTPLVTDGHTLSQICVDGGLLTNNQQLSALQVGVRIAKTNDDNLVLHLISPQGTSIELYEDRGGPGVTNLGVTDTNGNFVYLTFTDNTNLAPQLIKFTPPPFGVPPTTNNEPAGSFEITPGDYGLSDGLITTLATNVDGWTVVTNQVAVVTNRDLYSPAPDGTNYLALATGTISNLFPTAIGQSYVLTYAVRGPGLLDWWPLDNYTNVDDIIGTNNGRVTVGPQFLTNVTGQVGYALQFPSTNASPGGATVNFGAAAGNFGSNDFTIDYWINTHATNSAESLLDKGTTCDVNSSFWENLITGGHVEMDLGGGGGMPVITLTSTMTNNDGLWHHIAWVRNGIILQLYVDGLLDGSASTLTNYSLANAAPLLLGNSFCRATDNSVHFTGAIDEMDLWNRALTDVEIAAIYQAGTNHVGKGDATSILPHAEFLLNVNTNVVFTNAFITNEELVMPASSTNWVTNALYFTATSTNTSILLQGHPLGLLFDNFILQTPSDNNYVQPEESLQPFTGQNPSGCWTLDVWDTRTDSSLAANGFLLGWDLQMTVSSTNVNLIVLTNHLPYLTGTVTNNSIAYFAFDVPVDAVIDTNTLFNCVSNGPGGFPAPLNLLFNQTALPTGSGLGDFTLLTGVTVSNACVLSNNVAPPALLPGARYYLGVQNNNNYSVTFSIQVDTQILSVTNAILLTNAVAYTNTITNAPQVYSFVVPTNAVMASFTILNPTNALELFARHALPVPTTNMFDYQAAYQSTNNESIVVSTNFTILGLPAGTDSVPVPLTPGTWYLSVYNFNTNSTNTYQVVASYVTNAAIFITPLTNAVVTGSVTNYVANSTIGPGPDLTNFFSYTVSNPGATGVQFKLTGAGLDLIVQNGALPTPENLTDGSFEPLAGSQVVTIVTNSVLSSVVGTTWYLGVPNNLSSTVSFTISATTLTNAPPGFTTPAISSMHVANNQFSLNWAAVPNARYQVNISSDLLHWTNAATITTSGTTGSYADPGSVRQNAERFYQVIRTQ